MSSPLNNRNIHGVPAFTEDGTEIVAATIATVNDRVYNVVANIVATEVDAHDEVAGYLIAGTFKNDGGTLTQIGSTTVLHSAESTGGWTVAFAVDGTDIQIKVTGAAATNVAWLVDAEVKNLGNVLATEDTEDAGVFHPNGGIIGESAGA